MQFTYLRAAALCLPALVLGFDPIIMSLLLTPLSHYFSLHFSQVHWLLSAYLLAGSAFFIVGQQLVKGGARRSLLATSLLVYAAAALVAAYTHVFVGLIIARGVQGICSAFILMASLAYLDEHDSPDRYKLWVWVIVAMLGIAVGSLVFDVLMVAFGWQGIFVLECLLMFISGVAALTVLPATDTHRSVPIDVISPLLWLIALICVGLWLSDANRFGWMSSIALTYFVVGLLVFIGFFLYEAQAHRRHLETQLKRDELSIATLTGFLAYFMVFAWLILLGVFLQSAYGLSYWQAGKAYLPFTVAFALALYPLRRVAGRWGFTATLGVGVVCAALSWLIIACVAQGFTYAKVVFPFVLFGVGMSALFYIAHNRYSLSSTMTDSVRARRFSMMWLGGFIASCLFSILYNEFSAYDLRVLDYFFSSSSVIWNYALQLCAIILFVGSLFMGLLVYAQWRLEKNA